MHKCGVQHSYDISATRSSSLYGTYIPLDRTTRLNAQVRCLAQLRHQRNAIVKSLRYIHTFGPNGALEVESLRYIPLDRTIRLNAQVRCLAQLRHQRNAIVEFLGTYIPLDRTTRLNAHVRCLAQLRHQLNAIVESLRYKPLDRTMRLNAQVRCLV